MFFTVFIKPNTNATHCVGWYLAKQNGAEEDRTPDLLHAMQALSQLSYSPLKPSLFFSKKSFKTPITITFDFPIVNLRKESPSGKWCMYPSTIFRNQVDNGRRDNYSLF